MPLATAPHLPNRLRRGGQGQAACITLAVATALASPTTVAHAKVGDCPVVQEAGVQYISHAHTVEAIDARSGQRLWRATLFPEGQRVLNNPRLEDDVQMNRACVIRVLPGWLRAQDLLGHHHLLNRDTGAVFSLP
jgi:hypothetical protein